MKNERGFGLVGLLVLLPFLLSILATIAAAALAFKADAHLKHECRVSVLNSQRSAAEKLRELIRLNPRAQSLRSQEKAAQTALKSAEATGLPQLIAPAEAYLALVKFQRRLLALHQKTLIVQATGTSSTAPLRARAAVMSGLDREITSNGGRRPATRTSMRPGRFNLKAIPEGDLTPNYNPADTSTKDQVVDLDVTVDVSSLLPEWLRKLLPTGGLQVSSHCQATIEKKENEWVETLNEVK